MLHLLAFVYFTGMLASSAAIIATTLVRYREEIIAALGILPASSLAPLAVAHRPVGRARVIRTTTIAPERRLAA